MAASTASMPTLSERQSASNDAKPIPKPNLDAKTAAEVYPIEQLIGLEILKSIHVRDWIEKVEAGEDIMTKSRFVSGRIRKVVKSKEVRLMKTLKSILLLVEWYRCLKAPSKGLRKIPRREEIVETIPEASEAVLDAIVHKFAEGS